MDFVAIDFETATHKRHSACALALTEVENGEILGTHFTLIKPPNNEYSPFMADIHRIAPAMTEDAESFESLWPWIRTIVEGKIIVAHNAKFDIGVLEKCMEFYRLEGLVIRGGLCSVTIAQEALPWLENHKLSTLAKYFEIELDHHNARSDAEACAAITLKMIRPIKENGDIELNEIEFKEDFVAPEVKKSPSQKAFRRNWQKQSGVSACDQSKHDINSFSADGRFEGFVFIFTGELESLTRDDAEELVKKLGATMPSKGVTRKTTHVVVGNGGEGTGKHRRAEEILAKGLPIRIWTEAAFLEAAGLKDY